ncbi:MAG TPA: YqgE/AlgH family protein [Acidimicrobiales bacterium]|nr:YqgE/AlgH family protein [Acidimicrobiales bacterium]
MPDDAPPSRAEDAEDADEPDDLTGRLLVASPRLGDPNFERTVIIVLDHGPEGALGVVLNRPTGLPVDEILDPWREHALAAPPGVVFRGGPVSPDAVIGLARTEADEIDESRWRIVLDGVGTVDLAVAPDEQPVVVCAVRMFAGYAGWSPDQLEEELAEGAWIVIDAVIDDVFSPEADALWHDVLQRQGGKLAWLASYPPHPSVN